ncbi:MAG: hypothetical protein FP831_10600, partial [Anaerolineae bacterium]|nr:hypothetical protein [Anaerolineae bacterium]
FGGKGDDILDGGKGDDFLYGGVGNDILNGGSGDDALFGGKGDDTMDGGSGNDFLAGGVGNDVMNGGSGHDFLLGGEGDDTMDGGDGHDFLAGGVGNDVMNGGSGNDFLLGGEGNDIMTGDAGNDIVLGEEGDDTITTSEGRDYIDAGLGTDTLIITGINGNGETQETYATGGAGVNYFLFMAGAYGDLLLESQGEDTLDFSSYDRGVTIDMSKTDERQQVATWDEADTVDPTITVTKSLWVTLRGLFTNLIGSNEDDVLRGNDLVNTIEGRDGNDQIGGGGGVDNIFGGDQSDALNSYDPSDGMDIDLDAVAVPGGVNHEDNWHSIELPVALPLPPSPISTPAALLVPVTGVGGNLFIPVTGGGRGLVAGEGHTCALVGNEVVCWGENTSGQTGQDASIAQATPAFVEGLDGIVSLSAGSKHTCALDANGDVWCWGENADGQLGSGTIENSSVPTKVTGLPAKVQMVTGGNNFTCSLLMNQEVWCWGDNTYGQLNDGTLIDQSAPVKSKLSNLIYQMSAGHNSVLVGSLGYAEAWSNAKATQMTGTGTTVSISANKWGDGGCAVSESTDVPGAGEVMCWGSDMVPQEINNPMPALMVSTGWAHTCGINMDGTVSCWGANKEGELGNNSTSDSSTPVLVGGIVQATDLVAGMKHTCVVEGLENTVKCWGDNSLGQLGGFTGAHSTSPVSIIIPTK